ncbi:ATP-binding cassette domain-containing protein [Candidatus Thiothrix sp. Deng01]|uniref:ATP-binding cassette domain-containing protein n=1 Tax=Candidatus Thiothrix phosphatis TaxID=3112415 RepID=A0ABU6CTP4_9GAMM|nr:ATP-binding cassette domain-containing protein [Candidatus Thiothrix sp. Deng01]MEB4589956.1 ATP-binding cassette domain-containing protein [Candidatus Thiothrix sp. Deng01]
MYLIENLHPSLQKILDQNAPTFRAILVFSFFINLLMLSIPLYLLQVYSKVIPSHAFDSLYFLTGMVMVALSVLAALERVRHKLFSKFGAFFDEMINQQVLETILKKSADKAAPKSIKGLVHLDTVQRFLSGSQVIFLLDIPWTPLYLSILYLLHPVLGIVVSLAAVFLIILGLINEKVSRQLLQDSENANKDRFDKAAHFASNADIIESMGMRPNVLDRWGSIAEQTQGKRAKNSTLEMHIRTTLKFSRLLLQVVVVSVATWLILNKELSPGSTIAAVLLMRQAVTPLESAIQSLSHFIKAREAFFGINEYLHDGEKFKKPLNLPAPTGKLVLESVGFRYSGSPQPVFDKVNLTITPREIIALTGKMGTGKSTLARILVGLLEPSRGKVHLGSHDLSLWDSRQLGPHVGYLPQKASLFSGTVRENISRLEQGEIEKVIQAAKLVRIHNMIENWPDSYEMDVGEDGQKLSGGQRQMVALARAIYGLPKLIVLDEPDAGLDKEGLASLAIALQLLKNKGSIVVIITHNPSMHRFADAVYELSSGRLKRIDDENSQKPTKVVDFVRKA